MRQFECGTVVEGCDGVVTGETDDEVVAAIREGTHDA
jgi:predicted small metal-binding protein